MPTNALKDMAKKAGVSIQKAEKLWNEAKDAADKKGLNPEGDGYWAYIVGTVKNMLGVESIDLLKLGYSPKVLSEAIIDKSSASFMKSRMRKVTDVISNIGDGEPNWKSLALNLRLFFNEYLSSLSSNTGLKALLLGEGLNRTVPSILRYLEEAGSVEDIVSLYTSVLPDISRAEVAEVLNA